MSYKDTGKQNFFSVVVLNLGLPVYTEFPGLKIFPLHNFPNLDYLLILVGEGVSGGFWALFSIELLAFYHQNLGIFWDVWFFQNFFFSPKKLPYYAQITF